MKSLAPFYNHTAPFSVPTYSATTSPPNPQLNPRDPTRCEILRPKAHLPTPNIYEYQVCYDPLHGVPDSYWGMDLATLKTFKLTYKSNPEPFMQVRSDTPDVLEFILYPKDLQTLVARSSVIADMEITRGPHSKRNYPHVDDLLRAPVTPISIARSKPTKLSDMLRTEFMTRYCRALVQAARDNDALNTTPMAQMAGVIPWQVAISASLRKLPRPVLECFVQEPTNSTVGRVEFPHDPYTGITTSVGGLMPGANTDTSGMLVSSRLLHTMARMPSGRLGIEVAPLHPRVQAVSIEWGVIEETDSLGLNDPPSALREPCWRVTLGLGSRTFILPVTSKYTTYAPLIIRLKCNYSLVDKDYADSVNMSPWEIPHLVPESYTIDAVDLAKQGIIDRADWCDGLGIKRNDGLAGAARLSKESSSKTTSVLAMKSVLSKRFWHYNVAGHPLAKPDKWVRWVLRIAFTGDGPNPSEGWGRVHDVLDTHVQLPKPAHNGAPLRNSAEFIGKLHDAIDSLYQTNIQEIFGYYNSSSYDYDTAKPGGYVKVTTTGNSGWGLAYDLFAVLLLRQRVLREYYLAGTLGNYVTHNPGASFNDSILPDVDFALQQTVAMLYQFTYLDQKRAKIMDAIVYPFRMEDTSKAYAKRRFLENAQDVYRTMGIVADLLDTKDNLTPDVGA